MASASPQTSYSRDLRHWQALSPPGGQDLHVTQRIGRLGPLVAQAAGFRIGGE
jgi:hypothetical protein